MMPKFLIDFTPGKAIRIFMNGKLLERVIRIDDVRSAGEDELSEITITFQTDDIKLKDNDGRVLDILDGYKEVRDV